MSTRRMVVAPDGYGERVALAIRSVPGKVGEKAALLGVEVVYVYQAQRGHRGWSEPAKLAAACGVPEVLLVYGPTDLLVSVLAARRNARIGTVQPL